MKRALAFTLVVSFFAIGCATSPTYRAAVDNYAQDVAERHAICYERVETEELRRELVINDANLKCVSDVQRDQSSKREPSAACKCADATGANWSTLCADFIQGD